MDFSNFDKSFSKLESILRSKIDAKRSHYGDLVYGNYLSYDDEVKIIVGRIEEENQKMMLHIKEIFNILRRNENPNVELLRDLGKNAALLRLDIKTFFIFTRIFLDTLARIIRLFYDKKGEQLPTSMTDILKSKKAMELDSNFFKDLIEKMSWYDDFVKTRDDIVHYLGDMKSTSTREGDLGFDFLGVKDKRSWGTDTVKSISHYIEDTLINLSEVILFIASYQLH